MGIHASAGGSARNPSAALEFEKSRWWWRRWWWRWRWWWWWRRRWWWWWRRWRRLDSHRGEVHARFPDGGRWSVGEPNLTFLRSCCHTWLTLVGRNLCCTSIS